VARVNLFKTRTPRSVCFGRTTSQSPLQAPRHANSSLELPCEIARGLLTSLAEDALPLVDVSMPEKYRPSLKRDVVKAGRRGDFTIAEVALDLDVSVEWGGRGCAKPTSATVASAPATSK
jgi:hypothetical protein